MGFEDKDDYLITEEQMDYFEKIINSPELLSTSTMLLTLANVAYRAGQLERNFYDEACHVYDTITGMENEQGTKITTGETT